MVVADVVAAGDARLCSWVGTLETSWLSVGLARLPAEVAVADVVRSGLRSPGRSEWRCAVPR